MLLSKHAVRETDVFAEAPAGFEQVSAQGHVSSLSDPAKVRSREPIGAAPIKPSGFQPKVRSGTDSPFPCGAGERSGRDDAASRSREGEIFQRRGVAAQPARTSNRIVVDEGDYLPGSAPSSSVASPAQARDWRRHVDRCVLCRDSLDALITGGVVHHDQFVAWVIEPAKCGEAMLQGGWTLPRADDDRTDRISRHLCQHRRMRVPQSQQLPRKVVHMLSSAAIEDAGIAAIRIVADLGRSLDPSRYRLEAWFLEADGPLSHELREAGVHTRLVRFAGLQDLAGVRRMGVALRAAQPSLLHLHLGGRSRLWSLRPLTRAKLVAHLHGTHDERGRPLRLEPSASVDAVVAVSQAVARAAGGNAVVIYPGIGIEIDAAERASAPTVVGTAARLVPIKGLEVLLHASAQLQPRYPDLRVAFAGDGPSRARLEGLAGQLGIRHSVDFLGWRDDVQDLHHGWRAFVAPSIHEGLSLGVMEAMASGLPVVASATGGLPELVEEGITGFLVPVGDPARLAARLDLLLSDDALQRSMGEAARRTARERFGPERMAASILDLYDGLLGPSSGRCGS